MPNICEVCSEDNPLVEWNLLRMERYRLKTFNKNWPSSRLGNSSGATLAMNGFYYTGVGAKVQCVFCLGFLEPTENVWLMDIGLIHFHKYQTCNFAKGYPCGNIPIKPGLRSFVAFERMPNHLARALEFEPEFMRLADSSMPEGFDFFVDPDDEMDISSSDDDDDFE
jgi:hypothetical protein